MKNKILFLIIGLVLGIGGSIYAQTVNLKSMDVDVIKIEKTDKEKIDFFEKELKEKNDLVSKYAKLYDTCKSK